MKRDYETLMGIDVKVKACVRSKRITEVQVDKVGTLTQARRLWKPPVGDATWAAKVVCLMSAAEASTHANPK